MSSSRRLATYLSLLLFYCLQIFIVTAYSACLEDQYFFLPIQVSRSTQQVSTQQLSLQAITASITLLIVLSSVIGRYALGTAQLALLGLRKTAVIEAQNKARQYSSRRLYLKILIRQAVIRLILAYSTLFIILSGPRALKGNATQIIACTSFSLISSILIQLLYVVFSMSSKSALGSVRKKTS